jgi:hypothetical protein
MASTDVAEPGAHSVHRVVFHTGSDPGVRPHTSQDMGVTIAAPECVK